MLNKKNIKLLEYDESQGAMTIILKEKENHKGFLTDRIKVRCTYEECRVKAKELREFKQI